MTSYTGQNPGVDLEGSECPSMEDGNWRSCSCKLRIGAYHGSGGRRVPHSQKHRLQGKVCRSVLPDLSFRGRNN